jgi:hypothetical protein
MMGETLIDNIIMPTGISQIGKWDQPNSNFKYNPTHFIQDPIKVILNREQSITGGDFGTQSINAIRKEAKKKQGGIVGDLLYDQADYFGIITKLFSLKRPLEPNSSIICVMACIRTSHTTSSDSYKIATGRTLNFAISVSASNPALKEITMRAVKNANVHSKHGDGSDKTGSFLLVGPANYSEKSVAKFVAEGALTRNKLSTFYGRDKPTSVAEATALLNEYLDSQEYSAWGNHYIKKGENSLDKEKIKENFKSVIKILTGGTRRKRKSGGNKKTRRMRNRTK